MNCCHQQIWPLLYRIIPLLAVAAGWTGAAYGEIHRLGPEGRNAVITEAVSQAHAGDTLMIGAGTYSEYDIVIDKPLTILGEKYPVIDGMGQGQVIKVTSSDVRISGLDIRGAAISFIEDYAGLLLENVSRCVIDGNRFHGNFFALYLAKASDCRIYGNDIIGVAESESRSGNGIHLWYCRDITIENNRVAGHRDGIYFEFVQSSRIVGNESEKNLRYGLHFMFSDSCRYENNSFRNNGAGVAVMYTHFVIMKENRFEKNWGPSSYGLLLKELTDSKVIGNTFSKNTIGIYLEGCTRIDVLANDFVDNGWGVKIMANAMHNRFTRNNFIGNSFPVATNSRQNFSEFDGNYWSDYSGYDLDRDGIGDVAYRPVSLYSLVVEQNPVLLILLHSLAIDCINVAERLLPSLTPETLIDRNPALEPYL
jgi:nitrous oxidase accessory protein